MSSSKHPVGYQCLQCGGFDLLCSHGNKDIPVYHGQQDAPPTAWIGTNALGHRFLRFKKPDDIYNPQPLYLPAHE